MTQAPEAPARTQARISEHTFRTDPWWKTPRIVAAGLTIWVANATAHVFAGHWYYVAKYHYLTPFYSPCINDECVPGSSTLGHWLPALAPVIPYALVSLPFILGFRLSCYYFGPEHLRPGASVPRSGRELRPRPRHADHAGQRHPAVVLHPGLPLVPAYHRRAAQALFKAPGSLLALDARVVAERAAPSVRLDHPRHADADRPVHPAPGQRGLLRSEILQSTERAVV